MSVMVLELYEALKKAGVDDAVAREAARAVLGVEAREQLMTKADGAELRAAMFELKAELIKWNVGTMIALAGICVAIVKLL
jgi:hypothetical protein